MCDQLHEFLSGLRFTEGSCEVTSGREGILLLHPTHLHAHVLSFDDDDHPKRIKCLLDAVLDLRRQTLLYLQARSLESPVIYPLGI